jgi:hypothetical protein
MLGGFAPYNVDGLGYGFRPRGEAFQEEQPMVKGIALKAAIVIGVAAAAGLALPPVPAQARVVVGVGIGVPYVAPAPWYYYPPPPVVYAPPVYVPPPAPYPYPSPLPQPAAVAPQAQNWYYCDNPRGYYPYVQNCNHEWRPVPAQPQGGPPQ